MIHRIWVDEIADWPQPCRGITLHQPWPTLILSGHKRWETRSRRMRYRGPILLHAAQTTDTFWQFWRDAHQTGDLTARRVVEALPDDLDFDDDWPVPFGAVVGSAMVTDCVRIAGNTVHHWTEVREHGRAFCFMDRHAYGGDRDGLWDCSWNYDQDRGEVDPEGYLDDQLPFGNWTEPGWAIRLEQVAPARERCPVCWGTGNLACVSYPTGPAWNADHGAHRCPTCQGLGHCEPFRVRGNQATPWNWTPTTEGTT